MAFKLSNESKTYQGRNLIFLSLAIFLGFTIFGLSENVKGPAIPPMQLDFDMSETVLGVILALNSFGYLIACVFTATLARRIGFKACLVICLAVMAVSGVAICFAPNIFALAVAFFILYLGNGMLEITLGVMAALIFTTNPGKMINLAHFFYGLGSVVGPVLSVNLMAVRLGETSFGWRYMYMIAMALALIPFCIGLFCKLKKPGKDAEKLDFKGYLKDPVAWLIILILGCGAISEVCIGSWLVNYLEKAAQFSSSNAAWTLTAFFALYALSRLLLGSFTDRFGLLRTILVATLGGAILIFAGVLIGGIGAILIAVSAIGVALIYPTVLAVVARHFAAVIDTAMTVTMTVMGVILMIAQLLVGVVIDVAQSIFASSAADGGVAVGYSFGMGFIGLCCLASFVFALLLHRRLKAAGSMV